MELGYQELDEYRHKTCSARQMFFCGYCKKDIEENPFAEGHGKWTAWWEYIGPNSGNPLVDEEGYLMMLVCPVCNETWWRDWEKQEGKEQEMNASNEETASSSMEEKKEKDPSSMECD